MNWILRAIDQVYRRLANELVLRMGKYDDLIPPPWMFSDPDRLDGSRNIREFVRIGESMVAWLIDQGLAPSHRVLEVGCGVGRMARPLTRHLKNGGNYDGIDISAEKIRYCQEKFERRYSNFHFHHADIYNKFYNPLGEQQALKYRFPFGDETFDFVFLVSVFTHMLPEDMEHYLSEVARVTVKNEKCICTFWLIDAELGSPYHEYSEVCKIYSKEYPEHGVLYIAEYVRDLYKRCGLRIQHVYRGNLNMRKQDIIVAVKQ
jgi:SAM-dependent methyltransferase